MGVEKTRDADSFGGKVAVFDVCNTLYRSNTTADFIEFYLRRRSPFKGQLFQTLRSRLLAPVWVCVNRVSGRDLFRLLAVGMLKGARPDIVAADASMFVRLFLPAKESAAVLSLMDDLKREGYRIVLMSASLAFVVNEIARVLNADQAFACTLATKGGMLTGRYARDIRARKHLIVAREFPKAKEIVVVTDNHEDLELIRLASKAWIVCKERKRARWARLLTANAAFVE